MVESEIYYNPEQVNKKNFSISKKELQHIIIAWLGITFAFSFASILSKDYIYIIAVLFGTLTGFIGHELAHKFSAIHFGAQARFFLWPMGLIFAIVMSLITFGNFVFAAPGAVYIWGKNISRRENGIISIFGPLANFAFAIFCILIAFIFVWFYPNLTIIKIILIISQINLFLGAFNLLPIPPLDGFKVFLWNKILWICSLLAFVGIYVLVFVFIF